MFSLDLKPVVFEQSYLAWILNEEKELVGKYNHINKQTLTKKQWEKSFSEARDLCLLIQNYISELNLITSAIKILLNALFIII